MDIRDLRLDLQRLLLHRQHLVGYFVFLFLLRHLHFDQLLHLLHHLLDLVLRLLAVCEYLLLLILLDLEVVVRLFDEALADQAEGTGSDGVPLAVGLLESAEDAKILCLLITWC